MLFQLGPLWFAEALLLFSAAAVVLRVVLPGKLAHFGLTVKQKADTPYPSATMMLAVAIITGLVAFAIRLYMPVGNAIWGLQLGYFPSYIVLFAVGYAAANGKKLEDIPENRARPLKLVALLTLPVILPLMFLADRFPVLARSPLGGWNLPSFVYAMWEPIVALGIIIALLQYSQYRFRTISPFLRTLSRRSFCIYIIHPVILVAISIALLNLTLPPLLKFGLVGSLACLACYFVAGLLLLRAC